MKRTLIISLLVIAALAAIGGVAYTFGTPQAPDVVASSATSGAAPAPGQPVPPPDPNAPLAVEIPGCRCHSDDPKIVEEHSTYRMNQCAGCHGGQTPTGQ